MRKIGTVLFWTLALVLIPLGASAEEAAAAASGTWGYALGAGLAAFFLPDLLGVRGGYAVGLAAIALAAAGAFLLSRGGEEMPAPAGKADEGEARRLALSDPLVALAALSGFGAFATQLLLVQSFALVLDQSVYAFGVVLVTVLP